MRYDICLQSFVNTDGRILDVAVNVFNGTMKNRQEAGMLTLQALDDAYKMFYMLPDFEIEGNPVGNEIHMVVRAGDRVLVKIDAVPLMQIARRGEPAKDSFVLPAQSRMLN